MTTGSRFDTADTATAYAAARPDYPDAVFDALDRITGGLAGAVVADVGAGTGISSRQLAARGARVVAIEVAPSMLARLAAASPDVHAVRGDGNALPLRDGTADLVTYAQSWHWVDPARAVPEFRRVLRRGGTFAAWWNRTRHDRPWELAQQARLSAACPSYHGDPPPAFQDGDDPRFLTGDFELPAERVEIEWSRDVSLDTHLAGLRSKSYVADLGPAGAEALLAAERAALLREPGTPVIRERFLTALVLVRE